MSYYPWNPLVLTKEVNQTPFKTDEKKKKQSPKWKEQGKLRYQIIYPFMDKYLRFIKRF